VFFQDLWLNRTTYFEFGGKDGAWDANTGSRLAENGEAMAKCIGGITRRGVVFSGSRRVAGNVTVMLFVREYAPKVARDFREEYNIHYCCGIIVVAIDDASKTVQLKCASRQIAENIKTFIEDRAGVELILLKNQVCSEYNAERVRNSLLGIEKTDGTVDLTEIKFARSGLFGGSAITVEAAFLQKSIAEGLQLLADQSIVDFRGPADLDYVTFMFKGRRARLETEVVRGGAMRLNFENAGWTPEAQAELEEAVFRTYGLPVNKLVDPGVAGLGYAGVYSHLLRVRTDGEVECYQRECFDELLDAGILRKLPKRIRGCRSGVCRLRLEPVLLAEQENCRACGQPLQEWDIDAIETDDAQIAAFVRDVLDRATDWKLSDRHHQFERRRYYSLEPHGSDCQDDRVCLIVNDRLTTTAKRDFERFSRPVVLVQAATDARVVFVDEDGIGRISLSSLLAAQHKDEDRGTADELCERMLSKLMQSYEERVSKAARHAQEVLSGDTTGMKGHQYETGIFNVVRVLFPYTHQLGREGKKEPDGFVSVPYYEENAAYADAEGWAWTYDAKHSDKSNGYDLNIDERRKIVEYINSFRANRKMFDGNRRKIKAHVIITNGISATNMQATADHVFGNDGVKKNNRDIRLAFVDQGFLLRLFEWAQEHSQELRSKRPYFNSLFIKSLDRDTAEKYLFLAVDDANDVIKELAAFRSIDTPVNGQALEASLDAAFSPLRYPRPAASNENGRANRDSKKVAAEPAKATAR
jgi:hypothetical protein